jgi:hypothetical protein
VALPAVGNSGGILSLWNKAIASRVFHFSGEGFIGVCLDLPQQQQKCCIVNVYAKCNIQDKRKMWDKITMSRRGFGGCLWCIVGDFNSVREASERRGMVTNMPYTSNLELAEFDSFLMDLGLEDMPIIGRNFTWFHPNGVTMSRLDRVLLSIGWSDVWTNPNVRVIPRDVSDHCLLVLRYDTINWCPKPFRFNNAWLDNKKFGEMVVKTWEEQSFSGWMGFVLK